MYVRWNVNSVVMRYFTSKASCILLLVALSMGSLSAQEFDLSVKEKNEILSEFNDYLSISNVSDDALGIQNNLDFLTSYLTRFDFEVSKWEVKETPYLYANLNVGAEKTLLIYLQLDALPADSSNWEQKDPFSPVLKHKIGSDWKEVEKGSEPIDSLALFARGASDSKGPAFSLLHALKRLHREGITPEVNIKIIGDTEEEKGSKNLTSLLALKSDELVADALLILDGTRSLADVPTLTWC